MINLRFLQLPATQVSNAGLVYPKNLANLKTLYLTGTQITDTGLVHLKGLTGLKTLHLRRAQITDAGFAELPGHKVAPPPLLPPVRVRLLATRCARQPQDTRRV